MSKSLGTASLLAGYAAELYRERNEITETVQGLAVRPETAQYLMDYPRSSTAGTTLLCRQLHDIANVNGGLDTTQRVRSGRVGGLFLILTDIVDSQIDIPSVPLKIREGYLDEGLRILLSGGSHAEGKDVQSVSFDLAQALHEMCVGKDDRGLFVSLFSDLIPDVKQQLSSTDMYEQLELAQKVGAACALLGAVAVEYVTHTEQPHARAAAAATGAYAECLDHAYEMNEDIQEGNPTYATLFLKKHGDSPLNRRQAKEDLLDIAGGIYKRGLDELEGAHREIYRATCKMIDVRYSFVKRIGAITSRRRVNV